MTKEEILAECTEKYQYSDTMELVVLEAAFEAMQEYADQETSALRAENERLTAENAALRQRIEELNKKADYLGGIIKQHLESQTDGMNLPRKS